MAEGSAAHRSRREWAIIIKRDLEPHVKKTTSPTRTIPFGRVESRLRELRREHYVPKQLSLGLYQRSSYDHNDQRSRGDIFKLAVVGAFLADSGKTLDDWKEISASVVEDPQAMLDKYTEARLHDFSTEDVRSMLSLDAIFSAWFGTMYNESVGPLLGALRSRFPSVNSVLLGKDTTFLEDVIDDMLKLENQIPLQLIRSALVLFFQILKQEDGNQRLAPSARSRGIEAAHTQADEVLHDICVRVASWSDPGLPGSISTNSVSEAKAKLNFNNCEHFLHCLYLGMISEGSQQRTRAAFTPASKENTNSVCLGSPVASASLLRKAGINFRGTTGLEPQFKKHLLGATLYLPRIRFVGDSMEALWRNLVAFEATWRSDASDNEDGFQHPFMSYLAFMDEFIDLEEDVVLLRKGRNPVIVNVGVGSNADIARIFNSMTTNYVHDVNRNDKWKIVREQVLNYYNGKGRRTWVEFRRTKLGKPWLFASFLAAAVLLVLTFLQTCYAILTYYRTHF